MSATQPIQTEQDVYRWMTQRVNQLSGSSAGLTTLCAAQPSTLPAATLSALDRRRQTIESFFRTCLDLLRDAIDGNTDPLVLRLLINEAPDQMGLALHKRILDSGRTPIPRFYRTDEAGLGSILELQCPGSGWGSHLLLLHWFAEQGLCHTTAPHEFREKFLDGVRSAIPQTEEAPAVLHLIDNASVPWDARCFIGLTRPAIRYWGYDELQSSLACSFVRSHSVSGLVAENLFSARLERWESGELEFDLPPLTLFDQKILLALPFLEETAERFSKEHRALFPETQLLRRGTMPHEGELMPVEDFLQLPPASRKQYFLKYAGCDVSRNWGSRAVFRLGTRSDRDLIGNAAAEWERDAFWIVQRALRVVETMEYVPRHGAGPLPAELFAKHSVFYTPLEVAGVRTIHRGHYKVHGQFDSVVGLSLPARGPDPEALRD